ncbi:MAG: hypothetical protein ACPGC9_00085 [Cytophagales bacterium]
MKTLVAIAWGILIGAIIGGVAGAISLAHQHKATNPHPTTSFFSSEKTTPVSIKSS